MAAFVASKPCSLVHLIYEKSIITETNVPSDMIVFPAGPKKLPIQDFLTKGLREVYPFVNRYIDTTDFQDFFTKFSLVIREQILKSMRNKARQRRSIPKYFEDFNILFNDANSYDNQVLTEAGLQPKEGNTVALTMVINLVLNNSLELLNRGFELDLYGLHEYNMIFSYQRYLYQLLVLNRKSMILSMCGDEILKRGQINLDDLSASHPAFLEKRRKFSSLQKLMCDEYELFRALMKVSIGMQFLFIYFEKEGIVKNIIQQEGVEKQVYESRFGILSGVPFPRYRTYDEFIVETRKAEAMTTKELQDIIKSNLTEGKNLLQKLIQTEDSQRSLTLLAKQTLEQLQRVIVMNSLSMTKASMFGSQSLVKVNHDSSLYWLPSIDVEKKSPPK